MGVEQDVGHRHVLLVTAHEWRRIRLRHVLTRRGYSVHLAASPREALHALAQGVLREKDGRHGPPDVVLIDQESLGRNAQLLIRTIGNAELGIPIVVLSPFRAADDVIACLRAGAADYISLPADSSQVLDVLQRVLALHSVM